jgi:glutamyl-tRNA synthetase
VLSALTFYRGRIAPSPTGLLHLGHARTFWVAAERARLEGWALIYRNDDLDRARCRSEFTTAAIEDLRWLGLGWEEGPDVGGPNAPYAQSQRTALYRRALEELHARKLIFPCTRSRRDVQEAAGAPHEQNGETDEPLYPKQFRPSSDAPLPALETTITVNWRFRVPDDEEIHFNDARLGSQRAAAGKDFGDFLVWRKDNTPSYQLACVVDDALMKITEVVRGADLVTSTFRQLLLFRALEWAAPRFYHCPLMLDESGQRLAKRHDALSLRSLREQRVSPASLIDQFSRELKIPTEKI